MGAAAIVAQQLVKRFGEREAVAGITFSVRRAECFGFLGLDGAGKTSIVRMVQCVSPPSSGALTVFEHDVRLAPPDDQVPARRSVAGQQPGP